MLPRAGLSASEGRPAGPRAGGCRAAPRRQRQRAATVPCPAMQPRAPPSPQRPPARAAPPALLCCASPLSVPPCRGIPCPSRPTTCMIQKSKGRRSATRLPPPSLFSLSCNRPPPPPCALEYQQLIVSSFGCRPPRSPRTIGAYSGKVPTRDTALPRRLASSPPRQPPPPPRL
jgi:hypothetical protein